jgi:hypothetical protein
MNTEQLITIRRDGEILGEWNKFDIRQFLESGAILPTDEAKDEDEWFPLLPAHRRRYSFFDWAGDDDNQFYYYRDGYMHGPRTGEEVDAFIASGFLVPTDLVAFIGAEEWIACEDLTEGVSDACEEVSVEHLDAAKELIKTGDWVSAGINAGMHLFNKRPKVDPEDENQS